MGERGLCKSPSPPFPRKPWEQWEQIRRTQQPCGLPAGSEWEQSGNKLGTEWEHSYIVKITRTYICFTCTSPTCWPAACRLPPAACRLPPAACRRVGADSHRRTSVELSARGPSLAHSSARLDRLQKIKGVVTVPNASNFTLIRPELSPELRAAIDRSMSLATWIRDSQPKERPFTTKSRFASAFFAMAFDHHASIVLLLDLGMKSAAFALARSVFEAFVRGLWVQFTAEEQQIRQLETAAKKWELSGLDGVLNKLQKRLPKELKEEIVLLRSTKTVSILHEYAQGGGLQIQRWVSEQGVEPLHSSEEIVELLQFVNRVAFRAAEQVARLAAQPDMQPLEIKLRTLQAANWV